MMYFLFILFSFKTFAQESLEAIEVSDSIVSEDLMGLATENQPLSSQTYKAQTLESQRIKSSNDLTYLDASVTNNYSGSGYWDSLNIRGFGVDNRSNYFRDGLRINAQSFIALENKESLEVIKGLGAFQNTGSAPSGAINYRVKRPKDIRELRLDLTERGGHLAHLDFGQTNKKIKYRFNVVNEEIKSPFNFNDGNRNLLGGSFNYELSSKSLLEAEIEWSRKSQQSLSAQGFWGDSRPSSHSELNLNNQSWAKPVEFDSLYYSLRYSYELNPQWYLSFSAGRQYSVTDDRMSYAFGCSRENNWTSFCSDGSFDVYDYRSENERRITQSTKIGLNGRVEGDVNQELSFNVRYSHLEEKLGFQSYNFVGEGNQQGSRLPANPLKNDPSTNLDEETLELFVVDRLSKEAWSLWLGGNFQYRYRSSWKYDQSEKSKTDDYFFTPWLALSREIKNKTWYISYAQTKESFITPNKPDYQNPSAILPVQTTHQYELGVKAKNFTSALFYLKKGRLYDDGEIYKVQGYLEQYGFETNAYFSTMSLEHQVSLMLLEVLQHAPDVYGKRAPNVPNVTFRYLNRLPFESFAIGSRIQYESSRYASYENHLSIPDWIKWDFFIEKKIRNLSLRAYLDNAFQKRFWKESPIQYGHHYLYQGAGRRLGVLAQYQF